MNTSMSKNEVELRSQIERLERERAILLRAMKLCQAQLQQLTFQDSELVKAREAAYRAIAEMD